jgi:hypothetical protein
MRECLTRNILNQINLFNKITTITFFMYTHTHTHKDMHTDRDRERERERDYISCLLLVLNKLIKLNSGVCYL